MVERHSSFAAVVIFAGCLLAGSTLAGTGGPLERMDIFGLEWTSDPAISPDGRSIVYVRNGMDITVDERVKRLWVVKADGAEHIALTGRDVEESNPVWSPDGDRIAFISESGEGAEIHVYWVNHGKSVRLTQLHRSPSGLAWSPDGDRIAFTMLVPERPPVLVEAPEKPKDAQWAEPPRVTTRLRYEEDGAGYIEPGFVQVFVIPDIGGTPRQVTHGPYRHEGTPSWSRDGKRLFFSGNRREGWELDFLESDVYSVDVETGEIGALTDRDGPDREPVVSPDGKWIAYLGFEDRKQTYQVSSLWVMASDGSDRRELTSELDRSVSALEWSGDSDGVYYQYHDQGDTRIGFTSLSGRSRLVADNLGGTTIGRPYAGGSFSVSDNDRLVYTISTPYRPADLALVRGERGEPRQITALNEDILGWRELGRVEEFWYESTVDGTEIQGWVVRPPGFEPGRAYPLLVEIHGGPISHYGPRFSPEIQLYAAAGYIVFYCNPRGSTGYGEAFGNLLYHDYPGDDYQDIMDGVERLIETGLASEEQLYVTGGSAGGIMTAWIVGKTDRFRAAAVVKPVMNWISKTLTADNYFQYAGYRYPGQPWESIDTYMKFSPISLVGNIETPTLVMVGTEDLRTPLSEAKQLYSALKIRGIDTALVEIPGAPHNIARRPSQLAAKVDHVLAWFAKYGDDEGRSAGGDESDD